MKVKHTKRVAVRLRPVHSRAPAAKAFAQRLKSWRQDAGLPLKYVAQSLHISVSTVSQWENSQRFPTIGKLDAIARLMHTRVCCLLYEGEGNCPGTH